MKARIIKSFLFIIIFCVSASGQDTIHASIIALPLQDSILLRWVADDWRDWKYTLNHGYILEKVTISNASGRLSGEKLRASRTTIMDTIKPWNEEQWRPIIALADDWEKLAAATIYGDFDLPDIEGNPFDPEIIENKVLLQENRYALSYHAANHSMQAAIKSGVGYIDRDVSPGYGYAYVLTPLTRADDFATSSNTIVSKNIAYSLPSLTIDSITWGDSTVAFSWSNLFTNETYVSFDVERSQDGGLTWEQRNSAPVVMIASEDNPYQASFSDSLADNNTEYQYRIRGNTHFATSGPYSESISGKGIPKVEISTPFLAILDEQADGSMRLGWQFDVEDNTKIAGFKVLRSEKYEGPYNAIHEGILSTDNRYFLDETPLPTAFYKVEVTDLYGRVFYSLPRINILKDIIAPNQPTIENCYLDTTASAIVIDWKPNQELDLEGYRLFSSYQEESGFQDVSDSLILHSTYSWKVPLKRNGETIYFKVMAIDQRSNFSHMSEACGVQFIDATPPAPPVIRRFSENERYIGLEWAASPAIEQVTHSIERSINQNNWRELVNFTEVDALNYFIDSVDLNEDLIYHYRVKAVDEAGLPAYSDVKRGKIRYSNIALPIKDIEVRQRENLPVAMVRWKYFAPDVIKQVEVYRKEGDTIMRKYIVLRANDLRQIYRPILEGLAQYQWEDQRIKNETQYQYFIKAKLRNGKTTVLSDGVSFMVE